MTYDDATAPMQAPSDHPTWPAHPQSLTRPSARTGPRERPSRMPPFTRPGCGVALAIGGAFLAGAMVAALVIGALFAQTPAPATSSLPAGGALKVTITDAFLNKALNASGSGGILTNVQTHIQSNGQLTISGALTGPFAAAGQTAVIVLEPVVSQDKLTVKAISGSVGGLPLPSLALGLIASSVNQQLDRASSISIGGGQSLTVQRVTFADGEMTVIYV